MPFQTRGYKSPRGSFTLEFHISALLDFGRSRVPPDVRHLVIRHLRQRHVEEQQDWRHHSCFHLLGQYVDP